MAVLAGADDASAEAPEWGGGRGLGRDLGENRRRQLILPSGALLPFVPVDMRDLQGRKLPLCVHRRRGVIPSTPPAAQGEMQLVVAGQEIVGGKLPILGLRRLTVGLDKIRPICQFCTCGVFQILGRHTGCLTKAVRWPSRTACFLSDKVLLSGCLIRNNCSQRLCAVCVLVGERLREGTVGAPEDF
jgi:hypothetical protein